jgi:FkbM family methyltransferase
MNSSFFERLRVRWTVASSFYSEGLGVADRVRLGIAGIARRRPFDDHTLYGRVMRTFFGRISARVAKLNGLRVCLDLSDFVDTMVFEELIVDGIYPIADVDFTPDLVIDAGSCRGIFSLLAHGRFPTAAIVCIEPEPSNAKRLREHLAMNGIEAQVAEAALSLAAKPITFTGNGFGGHISSVHGEGSFVVEAITLTQILEQYRPQRLLLKIDVEGAEREILPTLPPLLPTQTVIFIETHHSEEACNLYLASLRESGFIERVIRRRESEESGEEYVERVFVRK